MRCKFVRLFDCDESERAEKLRRVASGGLVPDQFSVELEVFRRLPGAPFAYWLPKSLLDVFDKCPVLADSGFVARITNPVGDNFRYARLWMEVPVRRESRWKPWAKGGDTTAPYSDIPDLISWDDRRHTYTGFLGTPSRQQARPANVQYFFAPGITWPSRAARLAMKVMPSGCISGAKGPAVFASTSGPGELLPLLAVLNSGAFSSLLHAQVARTSLAKSFEVGLIQGTPVPSLNGRSAARLSELARSMWSAQRGLDASVEVSHAFTVPALLQVEGGSFADRVVAWSDRVAAAELELAQDQAEIDELCFDLYGISEVDRRAITDGFGVSDNREVDDESDDESESNVELDPEGLAAGLVSWAIGVAVGRFDVRLATGERARLVEPDPFDPLPLCSPAMLTGEDGLPPDAPPADYPIDSSPVLVDDPGHELDLASRVRSVFDAVFGEDADRWWSDVGAVLDPRNAVQGWLRRGFFEYHVKTYSRSRRRAPIMWPIGTKSGSYRLWLYAHRVTGDTLFRILGDIVEPKLANEQRRLSDLTQETGLSPSATQRRTLDQQQTLVDELIEFRNELRTVAPLWNPDLNDGIVIVLAPLWRLFAHDRSWSKELRDRWTESARGEYDWSQLAMRIWPERVIPKCAEDRSLAIAHELEDVFWAQDNNNGDKWHPRHTPTTSIDELVAHRTSPTIQAARNHPTP